MKSNIDRPKRLPNIPSDLLVPHIHPQLLHTPFPRCFPTGSTKPFPSSFRFVDVSASNARCLIDSISNTKCARFGGELARQIVFGCVVVPENWASLFCVSVCLVLVTGTGAFDGFKWFGIVCCPGHCLLLSKNRGEIKNCFSSIFRYGAWKERTDWKFFFFNMKL